MLSWYGRMGVMWENQRKCMYRNHLYFLVQVVSPDSAIQMQVLKTNPTFHSSRQILVNNWNEKGSLWQLGFFQYSQMENGENSRKLAFLFRLINLFEVLLLPPLRRRKTLVAVLLSITYISQVMYRKCHSYVLKGKKDPTLGHWDLASSKLPINVSKTVETQRNVSKSNI